MIDETADSESTPVGPPDSDDATPNEIDLNHGSGGWLILLIFWAAGIALLTITLFGSLWLTEQFGIIAYREQSPVFGLIFTLLYALAIVLPAILFSRRIGYLRPKAILQTWTAAGLFALFCLPIRFASVSDGQSGALLQIACAGIFILAARWLLPTTSTNKATGPYWPGIVAAGLVVWPWVLWGAAGSWLDSLLNLAAGLLLGLAAAVIFSRRLLPALDATSDDVRANIGLGGLAMGTALTVMGASFGVSVQQLILMFLLPAAGWLLMGIAYWGRGRNATAGWIGTGLVIGLVAAAPLMLFDTDELVLILNLGSRDIGYWAVRATFLSLAIALLLGLLAILLARRLPEMGNSIAGPIAAVASVGLLAGLYVIAGQTGFNGERLFVILNEQAVWEDFEYPADYNQRREAVFNTLVSQSETTQAPIREMLDRLRTDYVPYYLSNALEVDGGPFVRLWLESRPEVDRVLVSPRLRPLPDPPLIASDTAAAPTEPQWNLTSIGATDVWQNFGVTGEGILIGQADSGVEASHPELSDSYRGNQADGLSGNEYNWFDPWSGSTSPIDFGGHGTHTLGSILGESVGVAPDAGWIGCVNLQRNLANPALYLDCLQFLFAPFPQGGDPMRDGRADLGAHVFNNSWGCPEFEGCDPNALQPAVLALREAGVFVVASAGNEGSACSTIGAPISLYDEVFSVGAVDSAGQIAQFSSRGPVTADGSGRVKPDIAAPGVDVLSSYPGGSYSYNSGTSMAGPHVAGVVALLWSANPALIGDIDQTESILASTARPYDFSAFATADCDGTAVPNNVVGYGLVDALAAVQAALEIAP